MDTNIKHMKKILLILLLSVSFISFSQGHRRALLMAKNAPAVDTRFIITVKSDNAGTSATDQFTIPTIGAGYLYDVETSDGYTATGITGNHTITFPSGAGTYDVFISGDFPRIYFNNTGDKLKILSVNNWGIYGVGSTNQFEAFRGCLNLIITATDSGNFGSISIFARTFRDTGITEVPFIDYSSGTNFSEFFSGASNLTTAQVGIYNSCPATNFSNAFNFTNLTQTSIDNILVSIESNGTSNGSFSQIGGSSPSATGEAAIDAMRLRGWTITVTGGY
jgi:hypothetical protein